MVEHIGAWGRRWKHQLRADEYDPLLMLDISRGVDPSRLPTAAVVEVVLATAEGTVEHWWLLMSHEGVDVCDSDPGFDPTVWMDTDVVTLTHLWMGDLTWVNAQRSGAMRCGGDIEARRALPAWIGVSRFAAIPLG